MTTILTGTAAGPRQSISTSGGIVYRTRLMGIRHAEAFAAALRANTRFTNVQLVTSLRATTELRYYVEFQPASNDRQADALAREFHKRAGKAATEGAGYIVVADPDTPAGYWLLSISGETYQLSTARGGSCSCPDYCFRAQRAGLPCKHLLALRATLELSAPRPAMSTTCDDSDMADDQTFRRGCAASLPAHLAEPAIEDAG